MPLRPALSRPIEIREKTPTGPMPYSFLEHTTDIRMRVVGDDLEELFGDALRGMTECVRAEPESGADAVERRISVESPDVTGLLVDFLNELLHGMHTNRETYTDVRFEDLTEDSVTAVADGLPVSGFGVDIKAVTWHEADVVRDAHGSFSTNIIFDI